MFDFFNSIGKYVGIAAEFLFGEDRSLGGEGKDEGMLGFLGRTFTETQTTQGTASARRQEEAARMKVPSLTGTTPGGRARVAGTPQGRTFVQGNRNQQQLLNAIRRGVSGVPRNPQYANIFPRATKRVGGARNIGLGTTQVKGATKVAAASVRKDIKVV